LQLLLNMFRIWGGKVVFDSGELVEQSVTAVVPNRTHARRDRRIEQAAENI
jgi:hypothetical protein